MNKPIVINACHGGFGLSEAGVRLYAQKKGLTLYPEHGRFAALGGPTWWTVPPEQRIGILPEDDWHKGTLEERRASNEAYSRYVLTPRDIARDDPDLIAVVRELGDEASGRFASLKIVEIPADVEWKIEEYDGLEWIAEKHRTWS
jgi:hypothetical protein